MFHNAVVYFSTVFNVLKKVDNPLMMTIVLGVDQHQKHTVFFVKISNKIQNSFGKGAKLENRNTLSISVQVFTSIYL